MLIGAMSRCSDALVAVIVVHMIDTIFPALSLTNNRITATEKNVLSPDAFQRCA